MDEESEYVAVIFAATRTKTHEDEYLHWANEMDELVQTQPGYLSHQSVRDPATRAGLTVAYFVDDASALAWKQLPEHLIAQRLGRGFFYENYSVRVAKVFREYGFDSSQKGSND